MFFLDSDFLKSFPSEMISQLLSRKVYSVMVSLPTANREGTDGIEPVPADDENPPDPLENMGLIEGRLSKIIYGNGDPLKPSPGS